MPSMVRRGPLALRLPGLSTPPLVYVHDDRDRHVSATLLAQSCWEPLETSVILSLLRPGDVFVDVGANIGYFTLVAAAAVGCLGRVFAFEPEPGNLELLQASVALNGFSWVSVDPCALGESAGTVDFYLSPSNFGDHSLIPAAGREKISIPLRRGDDCLPPGGRVDVIKMDVQGAEPAALAGLAATVAANLPRIRLLLEYCPVAMDQLQPGAAEQLLGLLRRWDLPIHVIDHWRDALVETTVDYLGDWLRACREDPGNEGFFNLLVGEPPEGIRRLPACGC